MRYVVRKDFYTRMRVVPWERRRKFFLAVLRTHRSFALAFIFQPFVLALSRYGLSRTKNRCVYTFSKHSVGRFYHLNRSAFRSFASFGMFFGLQKASW